MLEVQKYCNDNSLINGKFEHIGYMNKIFKTKKNACEYYDKFNPHMRSLDAHNNWISDWVPKTFLRYIIRIYSGECLNIDKFE
jgi:hypothetical protein